jgi:hypothetical protein
VLYAKTNHSRKKDRMGIRQQRESGYQLDGGAAKTKSVYAHFITGKTAFNLNLS